MPTEKKDDDWKKDFVNALIGAGQGASLDFGDELYGIGGGMQSMMYGMDPIAGYKGARDEARARTKKAEAESPNAYMAGNMLGSAAVPIPGLGAGRAALAGSKVTAKGLAGDAAKRIGTSMAMGGARAAGRSEADNLRDFLMEVGTGAAESADTLPSAAVATDLPRHNIGDVIDFEKMKKKLKKDKATGPDDSGGKDAWFLEKIDRLSGEKRKRTKEEVHADMQRKIEEKGGPYPGATRKLSESDVNRLDDLYMEINRAPRGERYDALDNEIQTILHGSKKKGVTGNLGKPSKEMMAENNKRAMREAGLSASEEMEARRIAAEALRDAEKKLGQRQTEGNVTSIDGRPIPKEALPRKRKEYTPEDALERVKITIDADSKNTATTRLISKIEKDGADEPYVGRDFHHAIAVENPKNRDILQPLPVPPSKIGDLKGVLGKGVLTGDSDPFAWVDSKYGVSKVLLEREKDRPLKIFTRSDLIGHDDYMERINPGKHEVNIVFSTPNPGIGRLIEPGAPSLKRRITAANRLADQGIKVKLHYQVFDNKNIPDSWRQFQPSEIEVMKELREMGLHPSVGLTVDKTPIQDKNLSQMLNVLGIEPKGRK